MKLLVGEVEHIRFSRLEFYEGFSDYASVNRVLDLKSRITLIAKFKYNNYFILDDILDYNFLSDNRIALHRAYIVSSDIVLDP